MAVDSTFFHISDDFGTVLAKGIVQILDDVSY